MIRTGDTIALVNKVTYEGGELPAGLVGTASNVLRINKERIVLFNPQETDEVFALSVNSVVKIKL